MLLLFAAESYPSYNTEAERKYAVAQERLADLRKSSKKKKYRSSWIDCIRTFELVEKKYPRSPSAADACFDRAGISFELYEFNKYPKDLNEAIQAYGQCQESYPKHAKAPEALYHVIEIHKVRKKDLNSAVKTYHKLAVIYPGSDWTSRAKAKLGLNGSTAKKEAEVRRRPGPVIAAAPKPPGGPGVVKSIRHWSGGAYTRVVIDQDKPGRFRAFELRNPDRLVFDILDARVDDAIDKDPRPVNDGILKQVRASQYAPDTVRVVLELASLRSYAAFPLHEPERLVIDVTGLSANADNGKEEKENLSNVQVASLPEVIPPISPHGPGASNSDPDERKNEKLSLSRQLGLKIKTIAIDAGHGGHDPGAVSRDGLREKHLTLDIARRLAVLVRDRLGCNVVMTRDKDVFIPLEQRPFIAKSKGADLFVSIHVNASRKRKAKGIETYIHGLNASDRDAMATAARENATTMKTLKELDSEVNKILKGLTTGSNDEDSLHLAHAVQTSLVDAVKPVQRHVADRSVKRAFFYVLINTEMPSILAEVGFISNPEEEKLLRKESYRQSIAEALFQGIKKYVEARNPLTAGI